MHFPKWKIFAVLAVCVWAIAQASTNFFTESQRRDMKFLPPATVKLGLDLQGGSYLLLRVDFQHFLKEHFDSMLDDIRKKFRAEKVGYINLKVSPGKDDSMNITFTSRDPKQNDDVIKALKTISKDFEVNVEGEDNFVISYSGDYLKKLQKDVLEKSIEIVRRRVDETGTREPIIQMQGVDRILLQVPGLQNPAELKELLGKTAKMTFHLMDEDDPFAMTTKIAKSDSMILSDVAKDSTRRYVVKKHIELSGEMLTDSQVTFDQAQPVVSFKFNNLGGKKFAQITTENIGKPFAVVLDGKVITAPRINSQILGGAGIITGNFTVPEANELALLLRSGALPAPLTIVEERTVGPSLGQDSIDAGKIAAVVAFLLITIMMLTVYRLFGMFACFALIINLFLILAILSVFGATLTMPGIAGLVLTMGIAVDANVLIFERIRDEIRNGKTPISAIDSGFRIAFATIIDTNLTTLIAAFLLYIYGSGTVKGFAVTLAVGIVASMFSAITLTKMFIYFWLKNKKPKTLKL